MKYSAAFASCLVALLLVGCQGDPSNEVVLASVEPASCGDVKNMHQIGDLYVAGGVTPSDYPLLKELGIKSILNIRGEGETPDFDSEQLAQAQGIAHVRVPWKGPDQLTADNLDAMRQVLREADRPMLFHCGSANRAAAGWLAYRVLDQGDDLDAALVQAKTIGLRTPEYETIVRAYIAERAAR